MAISLSGWIATRFASTPHRYIVGAMLLILTSLAIIPIGAVRLSLAAILGGALGEISSLTVLLVIVSFWPGWPTLGDRRLLLLPVVAGLALYWSVLSYGPFDLYRLGFIHASGGKLGSLFLLGTVGLVSLLMPVRTMALVSLACLSWSLGLQASTNLWDYLLDVPCVLIYLVLLMRTFLRRTEQ